VGYIIKRKKELIMFIKDILLHTVLLLIIISIGCKNNPVDSDHKLSLNIEGVSIIDSTFSLKAMYVTEAYKPSLLLEAKITFRADSNYAKILSSAVTIENIKKQFS